MGFPDWVGVVAVVAFLGGNGIAFAHYLLWQRSPRLFWTTSAMITVALAYIVLTGAAMDIARSLWPIPFDEVRGPEIRRRTDCMGPTLWGTGLVLSPIMLVLFLWLHKEKRLWVKAVAGVGFWFLFFLIFASPIPDNVAQLIDPDVKQKLPDHCQQRALG